MGQNAWNNVLIANMSQRLHVVMLITELSVMFTWIDLEMKQKTAH